MGNVVSTDKTWERITPKQTEEHEPSPADQLKAKSDTVQTDKPYRHENIRPPQARPPRNSDLRKGQDTPSTKTDRSSQNESRKTTSVQSKRPSPAPRPPRPTELGKTTGSETQSQSKRGQDKKKTLESPTLPSPSLASSSFVVPSKKVIDSGENTRSRTKTAKPILKAPMETTAGDDLSKNAEGDFTEAQAQTRVKSGVKSLKSVRLDLDNVQTNVEKQ